jgi:hypothetical protein
MHQHRVLGIERHGRAQQMPWRLLFRAERVGEAALGLRTIGKLPVRESRGRLGRDGMAAVERVICLQPEL